VAWLGAKRRQDRFDVAKSRAFDGPLSAADLFIADGTRIKLID